MRCLRSANDLFVAEKYTFNIAAFTDGCKSVKVKSEMSVFYSRFEMQSRISSIYPSIIAPIVQHPSIYFDYAEEVDSFGISVNDKTSLTNASQYIFTTKN